MSYRVFTAFDLSTEVVRNITEFRNKFPKQSSSVLRWTKIEQLHITLNFVGELREQDLKPIQGRLLKTFTETKPFSLEFNGSGIFPNEKNPRILWIGMQPTYDLLAVVEKNKAIFQEFGYPPEKRPFRAHITIGRFKDRSTRVELEQFLSGWDEQKSAFQAQQMIDHLTFYKSTLTPQGPIYSVITRIQFQ